MACCFDVGDCEAPINLKCNTCQHPKVAWIGDGYCDKELYEEGIKCCWDLDDCLNCKRLVIASIPRFGPQSLSSCQDPSQIAFSSISLGFLFDKIIQCDVCPTLLNEDKCALLGNGNCDQNLMNQNSCFDVGDCWWCPKCRNDYQNIRLGFERIQGLANDSESLHWI